MEKDGKSIIEKYKAQIDKLNSKHLVNA